MAHGHAVLPAGALLRSLLLVVLACVCAAFPIMMRLTALAAVVCISADSLASSFSRRGASPLASSAALCSLLLVRSSARQWYALHTLHSTSSSAHSRKQASTGSAG